MKREKWEPGDRAIIDTESHGAVAVILGKPHLPQGWAVNAVASGRHWVERETNLRRPRRDEIKLFKGAKKP